MIFRAPSSLRRFEYCHLQEKIQQMIDNETGDSRGTSALRDLLKYEPTTDLWGDMAWRGEYDVGVYEQGPGF